MIPSPQQEAIFKWFKVGKGNLVVRARAGTGKTTTILEGIQYAPDKRILLCAFNKRIATELQQRLPLGRAEAKTLHAVGFQFLKGQWKGVRTDQDRGARLVSQVDESAPADIQRLATRLASLAKGALPFGTEEELVALAEERELIPEDYREEAGWSTKAVAQIARQAMDAALEQDGTCDFDDMIYIPVHEGWISAWYDLVVVDEAQDMNASQLTIAQKSSRGRICVVGDDRQAIYGFRGADVGSIDRLKRELDAQELGLTITYRCPKAVVAVARTYVKDYSAADTAPEGTVSSAATKDMLETAEPGDFILSRKNAPLVGICLSLLRAGKRARVEGRDIGASLLALVKKLNPTSIPELLRKLTTHEQRQSERIRASGGSPEKVERRITELLDKTETLRALAEGMSGMRELAKRIEDLFADTGASRDQVVCSSVHKAKGLETERVYILKDTLRGNPAQVDEESNIAYVAISRAKRELVWVTT